ncbi:MAG: hypothetical protein HYY44_07935 [Deltaproteobacteria bacterium]|nr:hypothetical protein [Deltaproteobacteria bacterium]MBI4374321.1 hypothetical protein [Deltaproteobacteria bacterium]
MRVKNKVVLRGVISTFIVGLSLWGITLIGGAGGCGSTASSTRGATEGAGDDTTTEAGEASVASLSTIPSVDISNLDFSQASASASLSKLPAVVLKDAAVAAEAEKKKGLAGGFTAIGSSSRAGCEANSQKKEIIRHSQQAQLDRCYAEAMEKADFITIGSEAFSYYKIAPETGSAAEKEERCEGIPAEETEAIAACKKGDEGPANCEMKVRLGRFGTDLKIDLCECGSLVSEAIFGAVDSKYAIDATRIGKHNGKVNKMNFVGTVDLGTTGTVSEGLTTLGDGNATFTGKMDGPFGNGQIVFVADGPTSTNSITGVFNGSFKDNRTGFSTSFTGKTYAKFDKTNGCAKFSFSGPPPPMKCTDMLPFDLAAAQQGDFLNTMGSQLGVTLNKTTCATTNFCPNPDCDPNSNPDAAACRTPMVVAGADGCKRIVHEGVECFSTTNARVTTNNVVDLKQSFTIVDNASVTYYREVHDFDLTKLASDAPTVAFATNWDCSGTFTDIDFANFTSAQMETAEEELMTCFELETKGRGNTGMGGHDCNEKQMGNAVGNMAKNGPPSMGNFAGNCRRTSTTCPTPGREYFFVNPVDPANAKYCLVGPNTCADFTVANKEALNLTLLDPDGTTVKAIRFTQADTTRPATAATIDVSTTAGNCTVTCTVEQPTFTKPPEFDSKAAQQGQQFVQPGAPPPGGSGTAAAAPTTGPGSVAPGSAGYFPQACINAGLTTEQPCRDFCQETHGCG